MMIMPPQMLLYMALAPEAKLTYAAALQTVLRLVPRDRWPASVSVSDLL